MKERDKSEYVKKETSPRLTERILYEKFPTVKSGIFEEGTPESPSTKSVKKDSIYVPSEIKRAGALLQEARNSYGVTPAEIVYGMNGKTLRTEVEYLVDFEEGKVANPDLAKITEGVEKYIDPEDVRIKELKEIAERREEEAKWLWRLERDKISISEAATLIRLLDGETKINFAKRYSLPRMTVRYLEAGNVSPQPAFFNRFLQQTGFDAKQKKVAQLLRLRGQERESMSIIDFQDCNFGENISYLRIQKGYRHQDLGQAAGGKNQKWVSFIEQDKFVSIPNKSLEALFDGLAIPELLRDFMRRKSRREKPIISSEIHNVLLENYYFFTTDEDKANSPFSKEDRKYKDMIARKSSFGKALRTIREMKGLIPKDLAPVYAHVWKLEADETVPEDYVVAKLAKELGFNVLDETTRQLLRFAAEKRRYERVRGV